MHFYWQLRYYQSLLSQQQIWLLARIQSKMIMNHSSRRRQYQTVGQKAQNFYKSNELEKAINAERKKLELIQKLQQIVENICHVENMAECFSEDPIIVTLQRMENQAKQYDLKEIMKMINLAIGKRILNIELQRKRAEIESKIEKKRQIQDYFRENRVNKTNYQEIAIEKLKSNIYIAKPYSDGKAFVQSTVFYQKIARYVTEQSQSFQDIFYQCNYLQVVKNVNKIFFNNFSNSSSQESRRQASNQPLLKLSFFLFLIIASLCIALVLSSSTILSYLIFGINILMLSILAGMSCYNFFNFKNTKNQLQETLMEVNQYFKELNKKNAQEGRRFQWHCPDHFLYLQVQFKPKSEK